MKKWTGIVKLSFEIKLKSGQRTGGSGGDLDPGATIEASLAVLRDPATRRPYFPGSSLKGKMRSTLEKELGKSEGDGPCNCGSGNCAVCVLFGRHAGGAQQNKTPDSAPTRVIVRDAFLSSKSTEEWERRIREGQQTVEEKTENVIRRDSGRAEHPRTGERLLPGTAFDGEIVIHVYDKDNADDFVKTIRHILKVIEFGSAIGASGSRGYGQVEFGEIKELRKKLEEL